VTRRSCGAALLLLAISSSSSAEEPAAAPAEAAAQGPPAEASAPAPPPSAPAAASPAVPTLVAPPPPEPAPAAPPPAMPWMVPHYDKGFVLVASPTDAATPFYLKLNHVSQFKYSNTMAVNRTFTTHLGVEKDVQRRNDVQLTRDVFYFSGYVFDRRLDFNILVYTSSATLSATAAGYVGWIFGRAFALRAGFFSLPSLRSMTGTYPYFPGTDRSMEVNYMRPGFTQGIWADGELAPGWKYIAMMGNSLNTLDIAATKIDFNFAYSASVWWDHNDFGKPWNDWENHAAPALRIGAAFTYAREDRLSDLSTASPENNATWISDGTLLFETGSLATGVTISLANYYLAAADFGIKWRGLAFNTEFASRWLDHFSADGPLPISSLHDSGFEASLGYFVLKSKLEAYLRASYLHGTFADPVEGAVGLHFYPVRTRDVWLSAEAIGIRDSPFGSVLYIYSAGQTGLLVPVQFLLRF
jgi:hypothetical protein